MVTGAAGGGLRGLKGQRTRPEKWLGRKCGWGTMPPGPTLHTRDRQNQAD